MSNRLPRWWRNSPATGVATGFSKSRVVRCERRAGRRAIPGGAAVSVLCPTKDGVISGHGKVVTVVDVAPCGASGREQFIYVVALGDDLRVVPAEFLTLTEGGE